MDRLKWWLIGAGAAVIFSLFSGHIPCVHGDNEPHSTVTRSARVHAEDTNGELQVLNLSGTDLMVIVYYQTGPGTFEINASGILQPVPCEAPDTCSQDGNELFVGMPKTGTYEVALASMWGTVYRETIAVTIDADSKVSIVYNGN